jgi:molecular chaperone DnaJ
MTEKRDYYEVLGVSKTASSDEIRKAYRQAALKHHPDRNQGDPEAEARFKELGEAYAVLNDDDKRARYDRFGHAGVDGAAGGGPGFDGDIFSHFQDIFSDFFGGAGGQRGRRRGGPARGADLRVQQRLSFKEAFVGAKREVMLRSPIACETCSGSGAKPGTKRKTCGACGGAGQVSTARGFVMFTQTCHECGGEGSVVKSPCESCAGRGQVERTRKVVVTFPAGIDGGQRLRVPGQGLPGTSAEGRAGPPGDLFVDVELEPDERFERDGPDLATRVSLGIVDATLGAKRSIVLPDDSTVEIDFPAGTQPGEVVTLRGKGFPRLDGRGRGVLHAVAELRVPKAVTERASELLRALRAELDGPVDPSSEPAPSEGTQGTTP